jgi:hypothetical protein
MIGMFETATEMAGRFADPDAAVRYILAGKATITLRSAKTGTRFTYEIEREADEGKVCWVRVLTGGDNSADFQYLGMLNERREFRATKKSDRAQGHHELRGLRLVLAAALGQAPARAS